jgi:hypothetical protein
VGGELHSAEGSEDNEPGLEAAVGVGGFFVVAAGFGGVRFVFCVVGEHCVWLAWCNLDSFSGGRRHVDWLT